MNLKARVHPSGAAALVANSDLCRFRVEAIGGSAMAWNAANPDGRPTASGDFLEATARFTGLPANNFFFGKKWAQLVFASSMAVRQPYEVFYTGAATNHPGGTPTDPNWFHYYKQNAGGGAYTYTPVGRSSSISAGGIDSVRIGNEAYLGDTYIITSVVGGQLRAIGESGMNRYYADFLGVLAHESQHATNQTNDGPPVDRDSDRLSNVFEIGTSLTDPDEAFSAAIAGNFLAAAPPWFDREVYAGGVVEQSAITGASTAQDWANPGTNHGP